MGRRSSGPRRRQVRQEGDRRQAQRARAGPRAATSRPPLASSTARSASSKALRGPRRTSPPQRQRATHAREGGRRRMIAEVVGAGPASRSHASSRASARNCSAWRATRRRVVGQDEALKAVANAVRRALGPERPQPAHRQFLFLGPTGVGKTETCKAPPSSSSTRRGDDPRRHERVHGEARGRAASSAHPRLRRLRGRRRAHRGHPPPALRRRPARRDREGPSRRLQHPPAGARRRTPDRRPGTHRRLQEHDRRHDEQLRQQRHDPGTRRERAEDWEIDAAVRDLLRRAPPGSPPTR